MVLPWCRLFCYCRCLVLDLVSEFQFRWIACFCSADHAYARTVYDPWMSELRLLAYVGRWFGGNVGHFTLADDRFVGIKLLVREIGCEKFGYSWQFLRVGLPCA